MPTKFHPARYGSGINHNKSKSNIFTDIGGIQLVKKGNQKTIKIDGSFIDSILDQLFSIKDKRIDTLEGDDQTAFNTLFNISRALYDTDSYQIIRKMIDDRFAAIKRYSPFTISWYLKGWENKSNLVPNACNLFNASTLSPTDKSINLECEHNVILAQYEADTGYTFISLTSPKESDKAYLYINTNDLSSMIGLTNSDKKQLSESFNIKSVFLFSYNDDGHIKQLLDREVAVNDLKKRTDSVRSNNNKNNNKNNDIYIGAIVFVIIVIIILLIFFTSRK